MAFAEFLEHVQWEGKGIVKSVSLRDGVSMEDKQRRRSQLDPNVQSLEQRTVRGVGRKLKEKYVLLLVNLLTM